MAFDRLWSSIAILTLAGCSHHLLPPHDAGLSAPLPGALQNPLFVQAPDHEFLWLQLVDTLDDHFKIEREERIQVVGNVVTEGRIETIPTTGATLLEPWHRDSTRGYEKLHATLQSIRRRASVRVMPSAGGYLVEVAVLKEIEDVDRPEHSTVGASTLRHDGSLVRNAAGRQNNPETLGWIMLGRDTTLEEEILADLQARLAVEPGGLARTPGWH